MIITQEKTKRVVSSHDFDSVNCTIDAEDMRYVASLLRNNYSNPMLAVVREISANALDANQEANANRKVEITLPSKFEPKFCVRDFGNGLSQEDVFGLYSKYGKSTKRTSNNYIGAFGIGKFAPLSYGSNFTCVSFHGGNKTSYNIFVNEDDDTKIVKMHEESSSEPSGLSVEVAVSDSDVDKFREICKGFFRFFAYTERPFFHGLEDQDSFFVSYDIALEAKDNSWMIINDQEDYWRKTHRNAHAFMGRVHYPINVSSVDFQSLCQDESEARALSSLAELDNLYIRFDIGELKLHHSRESLEYNKPTQRAIIAKLSLIRSQIEEIAKEKLSNADCLWEAKAMYAQVVNALPSELKKVFENAFTWQGHKIDSFAFHRAYGLHDSLIITEYCKSTDSSATDGYRVRSQKTGRVLVGKQTTLVLQDIKSSHGNALRARTLFNDNPKLESVYIVYTDDSQAHDVLWADKDGWRLDLVSDKNISYTSKVAKAKLQKGTRASGESRASVQTFEFRGKGYTNSDHWLNSDETESLEKNAKGKLIYVPISNYKVVGDLYDLEGLTRSFNGFKGVANKVDSSFKDIKLYGIRKKDAEKLDQTKWVHWDEYRVDFAKSWLVKKQKELRLGAYRVIYKNHSSDLVNLNRLDCVLGNHSFIRNANKNLSEGHVLNEAITAMKSCMNSDDLVENLYLLMNLVKSFDPNWVKKNLKVDVSWKQIDFLFKEVIDSYPLLVNISKDIYSWRNLEEENYAKNIIDYISMCDKQGGEA